MSIKIALKSLAIAMLLISLSVFVAFATETRPDSRIGPPPLLPGTLTYATVEQITCTGETIEAQIVLPDACRYEFVYDVMVTDEGGKREKPTGKPIEYYQIYMNKANPAQVCAALVTHTVVVIDTPASHNRSLDIYVNGVLCNKE
jgi:hypothetical protein